MRWGYWVALALVLAVAIACNGTGQPSNEGDPTASPAVILTPPDLSPATVAADQEAVRGVYSSAQRLLDAGDVDALYPLYSESFRSQCSPERFARTIGVTSAVQAVSPEETREITDVLVAGDEAFVELQRTRGGEPAGTAEVALTREDGRWVLKVDARFTSTCLSDVMESDISADAFGAASVIIVQFLAKTREEATQELHSSSLTERFRSACPDAAALNAALGVDTRVGFVLSDPALLWEVSAEATRVEFTTSPDHRVPGVLAVAMVLEDGEWLVDGFIGVTDCS